MHETRGVEQHIDLSDALGHRDDIGAGARIELRQFGHAFALQRSEPVLVDIGREHVSPLARKGDRAGPTDPGGSRRHEGAFALEAV